MNNSTNMSETMLSENENRYVIFPIKHEPFLEMYKKAESNFWTTEELDLSKDIKDYNEKLSDNEKYFLNNVLAFFAASDGIVNQNLIEKFCQEVNYFRSKILLWFSDSNGKYPFRNIFIIN